MSSISRLSTRQNHHTSRLINVVAGGAVGGAVGFGIHAAMGQVTFHARSRTAATAEEWAAAAKSSLQSHTQQTLGSLCGNARAVLNTVIFDAVTPPNAGTCMHAVPSQASRGPDSNSSSSQAPVPSLEGAAEQAHVLIPVTPAMLVVAPVVPVAEVTPAANWVTLRSAPFCVAWPMSPAWHMQRTWQQPNCSTQLPSQLWSNCLWSDSDGGVSALEAATRREDAFSSTTASSASLRGSSVEVAPKPESRPLRRNRRARRSQRNSVAAHCAPAEAPIANVSRASSRVSDDSEYAFVATPSSIGSQPTFGPRRIAHCTSSRTSWADIEDEDDIVPVPADNAGEALKNAEFANSAGNKKLAEDDAHGAVAEYTRGLNWLGEAPADPAVKELRVVLLSNRAQTNLKLRCCTDAIADAEALFQETPVLEGMAMATDIHAGGPKFSLGQWVDYRFDGQGKEVRHVRGVVVNVDSGGSLTLKCGDVLKTVAKDDIARFSADNAGDAPVRIEVKAVDEFTKWRNHHRNGLVIHVRKRAADVKKKHPTADEAVTVQQITVQYGDTGETISKEDLAAELTGRDQVWETAKDEVGCYAVQFALGNSDEAGRAWLTREMQSHVQQACGSPHAHHVLQKLIEVSSGGEALQFMVDELQGSKFIGTCRHHFGCRVVQRLLEKCREDQREALGVDEILQATKTLAKDKFGNFVLQHILEKGTAPQKTRIVDLLLEMDMPDLVQHSVGSYVVQCALTKGGESNRSRLVEAVKDCSVAILKKSKFGSFVLREAMRAPSQQNDGTHLAVFAGRRDQFAREESVLSFQDVAL
mmetsp:Transcript_12297/g.27936  ORF Transcript_12297/g.27936 Transcript_12297/m.27936 type:complete len:813 (+) Transcript_12297:60-2498(+)